MNNIRDLLKWILVAFGWLFIGHLLLWLDMPPIIIELHKILFYIYMVAMIILHFLREIVKIIEETVEFIRGFFPKYPKLPSIPNSHTINWRDLGIKFLLVLLTICVAFLTLVYFKSLRQLVSLYTPFHRSLEALPEQPTVSSNLPNVRLILGDYEGHEVKVAHSRKVWATIMVSGLDKEVNGLIDWGDGTESKGIPIRNGVNAFGHSYSSSGSKTVKLKLQTDGQSLKMVDFDGNPKEEIIAKIEIPKGRY